MDYSIDGTDLIVGEETRSFEVPIKRAIDFEDFVVVLLKGTRDSHPHSLQNVLAIDPDGSIRWEIPAEPDGQPRPYTNIYTETGEDLHANNFAGYLYEVDPETGEILEREFVK